MANISNSNLYANYSNSYLSLYNNSHTDNKTTLNSTTTTPAQESKQNTTLSDDAILNKIQDKTHFYQETWRNLYANKSFRGNPHWYDFSGYIGASADTMDLNFYNNLDARLKQEKNGKQITFKEAQDAQEFLNKQMDSIMLEIYKSNPEVMEDTMEGEYRFYSNNGLKRTINVDDICVPRDYPELKFDKNISDLLHAYGARTEQENVDKILSDTLREIKSVPEGDFGERKIDEELQKLIGDYRDSKKTCSGYNFFACVTDMLSPKQQEQIVDAISKVVTFYSQPNSIEIDGINISWTPYSKDEGGFFSPFSHLQDNIEIKYQKDFNKTNNNLLASLSSNFDSTQSFFELLEKRDKLEKENQELKAKQAYSAYGISNATNSIQTDSKSDSLMQALLKDSKESKNAKTSKTS